MNHVPRKKFTDDQYIAIRDTADALAEQHARPFYKPYVVSVLMAAFRGSQRTDFESLIETWRKAQPRWFK
jgi:hypothetical protein